MKKYQQFCPLASALDLVGDRWTLLVVRELLFLGPRRFTDLATGLPGIPPNLLSARLTSLLEAGLIERVVLPPPGKATIYRLTPDGEALREPLVALMRWGAGHLEPPASGEPVRPELLLMALNLLVGGAPAVDVTIRLQVGEHVIVARLHDGRADVVPYVETMVQVSVSMGVFVELVQGRLDLMDALGDGRVSVTGDPERLGQLLELFTEATTP